MAHAGAEQRRHLLPGLLRLPRPKRRVRQARLHAVRTLEHPTGHGAGTLCALHPRNWASIGGSVPSMGSIRNGMLLARCFTPSVGTWVNFSGRGLIPEPARHGSFLLRISRWQRAFAYPAMCRGIRKISRHALRCLRRLLSASVTRSRGVSRERSICSHTWVFLLQPGWSVWRSF